MYNRSDIYHTSLAYSADYGNPASIRNCDEMMFSLDEFLRQQTFEDLVLSCTVT